MEVIEEAPLFWSLASRRGGSTLGSSRGKVGEGRRKKNRGGKEEEEKVEVTVISLDDDEDEEEEGKEDEREEKKWDGVCVDSSGMAPTRY